MMLTSQMRLEGIPRVSGDGGGELGSTTEGDENGLLVEELTTGLFSHRLVESDNRRRQRRMASWVTAIRIMFSVTLDDFFM